MFMFAALLPAVVAALLGAVPDGFPTDPVVDLIIHADDPARDAPVLTVTYPQPGTLFPPDLAPPTFLWKAASENANGWAIQAVSGSGAHTVQRVVDSPEWTPDAAVWESLKDGSVTSPGSVTIWEVELAKPLDILGRGRVEFLISEHEVGAPILYREVGLPFEIYSRDLSNSVESFVRWRLGPVSSTSKPPVILEDMRTCANCHSASMDGRTLALDVDFGNDKGAYAIMPIEKETKLSPEALISWSDFGKTQGKPSGGLLSQVSPTGRYIASTVNDVCVFVSLPDLVYSQLFFPIQGVIGVHDRETDEMFAIPGASDPQYVQSNPSWSPDEKYIVFARATRYDPPNLAEQQKRLMAEGRLPFILERQAAQPFIDGKEFKFDLYRVPFNGGKGGVAEPLPGASLNGKSNYFAKYSPDGRWIVFCQAENYMLLQPDSKLYILPAEGGEARELSCNTDRMNSWHSWSPNGKWLVFSTKANTPYTQLCLTHIDEAGNSSPPVFLTRFTDTAGAANIPEFINIADGDLDKIVVQDLWE